MADRESDGLPFDNPGKGLYEKGEAAHKAIEGAYNWVTGPLARFNQSSTHAVTGKSGPRRRGRKRGA